MGFIRRLVIAGLLLLPVLALGYIGYWSWVAHRIKSEVTGRAAQLRLAGYVVAWQDATVDGFPFSFRLILSQPTFEQNLAAPTYAVYADMLQAEARPFDLFDWTLATGAEAGLDVAGMPGNGRLSVRAGRLAGTLAAAAAGKRIVLQAVDLKAQMVASAGAVPIGRADADLFLPAAGQAETLPPAAAQAATVPATTVPAALQAAISLRDLQLRQGGPLGDRIAEVAVAGTMAPPIPPGRWPDALQRWRGSGGKIDLARVRIAWGALDATASGTLSVDAQSQPVGSGSATLAGLPATIDALVESGMIRPNDGAMAKVAIAALGQRGAVTLPVRVEPGALFLGPVRLMPLPRLAMP